MDWSEETVIAAIIAWYDKHGKPPIARDWKKAGYGHPCDVTVRRYFGSFRNGVWAAGIGPRRDGLPRYWDRERIAEAMRVWHAENGRWPTSHDWRAPNGAHVTRPGVRPGSRTVYKHFRTWRQAVRYAGLVSPPTAKEARQAQLDLDNAARKRALDRLDPEVRRLRWRQQSAARRARARASKP